MQRLRYGLVVCASASLAAIGCGPSTYSVNGTVTASGAPLENARLALADAQGLPVRTSDVDADGSYRFADVPEGSYTLVVIPTNADPPAVPEIDPEGPPPSMQPPPPTNDALGFDDKYLSAATSDATVDVGPGKPSEANFALD